MGFDAPTSVAIREKAVSRPFGTVLCPQCGTTNVATTDRCRSCMSVLPSKAAPTRATPNENPIPESRRTDFDAMFGELEALTRGEPPSAVQFQCPACGRIVDEAAARCGCGAIFAPPADVVGYACPLCGARVASDATACRCGARFSD